MVISLLLVADPYLPFYWWAGKEGNGWRCLTTRSYDQKNHVTVCKVRSSVCLYKHEIMSHMASQCKYKYGGVLNRFMLFSPNTGEEVTSEEGEDPGIVIFLSEDAMIHDVM